MLSVESLLPPQQGIVEGFEVLGGIGVAEEPVEGRPDEQAAEECPVGVVGLGEEELLGPGEGLCVELLQPGVGGDQRVLQRSGPKAELLRVSALQHLGGPLPQQRHRLLPGEDTAADTSPTLGSQVSSSRDSAHRSSRSATPAALKRAVFGIPVAEQRE